MNTERLFDSQIDRYAFDFKHCTYAAGYAQLDTAQDASYFGTWANPFRRIIVSFAEGDITIERCDTDAEFAEQIGNWARWNVEAGYTCGIDPGFNPDMHDRFDALGLGCFTH